MNRSSLGQPETWSGKLGGEQKKRPVGVRKNGHNDAWRRRLNGFEGNRRKDEAAPFGGNHLDGDKQRVYSSCSWKGWLSRVLMRTGSSQGAAQD